MRTIAFALIMFMIIFSVTSQACEPPIFLQFHEDAQFHLDSMNLFETNNGLVDSIILMHNLAFHKNQKIREQAEKLLKDNFKKDKKTPVIQAYEGSLRLIKISHRSKGSKIFRSIFGKSPYDEARDGFKLISQALSKEPDNLNIRLLRVSAAVEVLEHLPELFPFVETDLDWLEENIDHNDQVVVFYLNLIWAKFNYKYATILEIATAKSTMIEKATLYLQLAGESICNEVNCREYEIWEEKISSFKVE